MSLDIMGRQVRRRKQLLEDLKETTGYWKLKQEALDYTMWRTSFGEEMNERMNSHSWKHRIYQMTE